MTASVVRKQRLTHARALMTDTMVRFATHQEPINVVSDFNVWLDCSDDQHADQFRQLVDCNRLKLHATGPTHHLSGTLDAVIIQETNWLP